MKPSTWTQQPRHLTRVLLWSSLFVAGSPLVGSLTLDALGWMYPALDNLPHAPVIAIAGFVGLPWLWHRHRALKRKLQAADGRLCVDCGYNLTGTDDGQPCPECGRTYQAQADRAAWKRSINW